MGGEPTVRGRKRTPSRAAASLGARTGKEEERGARGVIRLPGKGRKGKKEEGRTEEEPVEKEKEKEDPENGGQIRGQEGSKAPLWRDRTRSRAEASEEVEKKDQEEAQEEQDKLQWVLPELQQLEFGGGRRRDLGGSVQGTKASRDGAWSLDHGVYSAHEDVCAASIGDDVGGRHGGHTTYYEPVREALRGTEDLGRAATRDGNARLHRRLVGAESPCGSLGRREPKAQEPRDDQLRPTLGNCPENRGGTSSRCVNDLQSGDAVGAERSEIGLPSQGIRILVGERKKQRQDQRQGQGQGKGKRRSKRKRGKQEKLLKKGDALGFQVAPEVERSWGEKDRTHLIGGEKTEDVAFSDESSRARAMFHYDEKGGAATPPGTTFCTGTLDGPPERDRAFSGLGRETAEKEWGAGNGKVGMEELSTWLEGKLDVFLDRLCKTKPSGRIFPLPTSSIYLSRVLPDFSRSVLSMLRTLVVSLNSLNGEGIWNASDGTPLQKEVLVGLAEDCRRVCSWVDKGSPVTWENFFKCRGIDYKGDEVLTAQAMQWENVRAALPKEVGGVALEDVVEMGSRHYVLNFDEYLLPVEDQIHTKPPRVLVPPAEWERFCAELLSRGVFDMVHEDDVYRVDGKPVLNGLFGVSKGEFDGPWESMRIIMNLVPINQVVRGIEGDVGTLPSWAGMTPLNLMPDEDLIVSSEDVRCFFYIFKIPLAWHRYMAFNRPLPPSLCGARAGTWYPCSAVLPMGFKNSVALAQHVHRYILRRALQTVPLGGEGELRKDRTFPSCPSMFRVYLDNFDELRKVSKQLAETVEGKVSPLIAGLREEYLRLGVPRHPKKGVASQRKAEVQGAIIDGEQGLAFPKPEKVLKYMQLSRLLLQQKMCTQKQAQVVAGGLVYLCLFRRPLLGCLNAVWKFITGFEGSPPFIKMTIPNEVKSEIARFMGLVPLAYMDFRTHISPHVTASDASEHGGGLTVSAGPSPVGCVASQCPVRGDLLEPVDLTSVLTIGLFDGIGALRVAADVLGWHVQGHISVEISPQAQRVVESRFPSTIAVADVREVTLEMVQSWARNFSQVGLVLLGAGPPCQGVSGLNASRKGALKDARSNLFTHVSRIRDLVIKSFPWAQVRNLMESVASMDWEDEQVMSAIFGCEPWQIDAAGVSLARRPRLYWCDWEIGRGDGVFPGESGSWRQELLLKAQLDEGKFLLPGWKKAGPEPLPTFTTSRPRSSPGYKPAGLKLCEADARDRWERDEFRFPPYQYRTCFSLINGKGEVRVPTVQEREVIMGFPKDYTVQCLPKAKQGTQDHVDMRMSLIGNSWNITVVAWILSQLGSLLGLNDQLSVQEIVQRTSPGPTNGFQSFLQRPYLERKRSPVNHECGDKLVRKLLTLVSIKGEDLLLQTETEDQVKYHRLRASIPANLWKWRTVAGWSWTGSKEHINVLELRAVLTSLRWRIERCKSLHKKFVHLVDSQVVLHALSRGRSSSRKLRRTLLRANALLLATRTQVVWAYVHTAQNPADRPSRHPRKRKWKHAKETS